MAGSKAMYKKMTNNTGVVYVNDIKKGIIFKISNSNFLFMTPTEKKEFRSTSEVHEYFGGLKEFDEAFNTSIDESTQTYGSN